MLKKPITFENPTTGEVVTQDYYFNLTNAECLELQLSEAAGWAENMEELLKAGETAKLIEATKKVITKSYGIRMPNGDFIKTPESAMAFASTEAYSVLFMELLTDASKAAEFFNGVMPKNISAAMREAGAFQGMTPSMTIIDEVSPPTSKPSRLDNLVPEENLGVKNNNDVQVKAGRPKQQRMSKDEILRGMKAKQRGWPKELTYEEVVAMSQEDLDAAMEAGCTIPA